MQKRGIVLLLIVWIILLTSAGCAGPKETPEAEGHSDNRQSYQFIFVCPILENQYWEECFKGIRKADEKLGTSTKIIGPQYADNFATEIIGFMEQAIAEEPDGIILYAGIDALAPLIEEATAKGIPVIALDSDAPSTSRVAYVGTDAYNVGYDAGEALVEAAGGKAKVGVLISSKSAEKEIQVLDALRDVIYDYDIEIVDIMETDADPDVAEERAREMLKAHPEITVMFNTAGYNVTGAARVKKEQGLDDLILIGFDDVEENLRFVREGIINMIFVQRIKDAGYQSVYLMKECIDNGGTLPKSSYDTGTILVKKDNVETYSDDAETFNMTKRTVKVGYYSGDNAFQSGFGDGERKSGYAYEYYQAIADVTGWDYEYVYGPRNEILKKLQNGEIDIAAGVYKSDELKSKVLFSDQDMGLDGIRRYFAVSPDNGELLDDLNYAISQVENSIPGYTSRLYQKYYSQVTQQMLTDAEAEWVKEKGVIKVGYVRHSLPLSAQGDDGAPTGVVKDLIEVIEKYAGIRVMPICFENVDEVEENLKNGVIDVAFPIYSDLWLSETKGIRQTDAFISDRVMILYNGSYSADLMEQVALAQTNIGIKDNLEKTYPDSRAVFYETRQNALEAVLKGNERCTMGCASIMQRLLSEYPDYQNLNIAYLDSSVEFGMAVRHDDNQLLDILNKTIRQMDEASITNSMLKYSNVEVSYTFREFVRQNAVYVILFLMVFIFLMGYVFIMYMKKNYMFKIEQEKAQNALEAALQKANTANEAKTTFLSSVSHDIRTPLNAIVGMTAIAHMNLEKNEKVADCLEKIDLSSRHLLTLINNVLDISKIESQQLQLSPVVFSMKNTMSSILHIVEPQVEAKKLQLETKLPSFEADRVYADEVRINQIFINILTNAIKYTPEGGKIVMELQEELVPDKPMVHLIYTVADNGIGMSKEFMKTMYQTFSRAKDSRINKIQGTGLGLAIVRQIVDMMQGTIDCTSEEGKGTKFVVTLDLAVRYGDEKLINDGTAKKLKDGIEKNHFMEGRHLLIAEDNELNWEVISGILEMFQVTADRAENGQVCVDMLCAAPQGTYDLILMDIQMPVMNGREAARAIRKDEREYIRNIPIIAMTADAFAEDVKASLEAGMNGHVSKPVDIDKLMQEMRQVLRSEE